MLVSLHFFRVFFSGNCCVSSSEVSIQYGWLMRLSDEYNGRDFWAGGAGRAQQHAMERIDKMGRVTSLFSSVCGKVKCQPKNISYLARPK